jgi:hypothetical protein
MSEIDAVYANKWDLRYRLFAIVLVIFLGVAAFNYPYYHYTCDFWEHTASLKELSAHIISPSNPHIDSSVPSPRYTIYLLFWAMVSNILKTGVFTTLALMSVFNLMILLTGLYCFIREYSRDPKLPFYALVIMLFFWGKGFAWSNEYQLRTLIYVLGYPSLFSFSCFLWGSYFITRYLNKHKIRYCFLAYLFGFVTFLCHPPTASPLFLTAVILALIQKNAKLRERLSVILLPLVCISLSLLWPYFSMYDLFFSVSPSHTVKHNPKLIFYSKSTLFRLGPMLLGIFFIWNYIMRNKNHLVTISFLSFTVLYLLSYYFPIVLGHRFIFYAAFYLHLAIAFKFREWELFSGKSLKESFFCRTDLSLIKLFCIATVIFSLCYNLILVKNEYLSDFISLKDKKIIFHKSDKPDMISKFSFLKEIIGEYDVVMADQKTSWMLPSFCGKVISIPKYHGNPLIEDSAQRRVDNVTFFERGTSRRLREELLSKYYVSYILLNLDFVNEEVARDIENLGAVVIQRNNLILIKI